MIGQKINEKDDINHKRRVMNIVSCLDVDGRLSKS